MSDLVSYFVIWPTLTEYVFILMWKLYCIKLSYFEFRMVDFFFIFYLDSQFGILNYNFLYLV